MENIAINIDEILDPIDFDESVDMLLKLKYNKPEQALDISFKILEKKTGDEYYQATAFETIYGINQQKGFDYIREHVNDSNLPVYVSMVECVTVDSGIYDESEGIENIIELLKARMMVLSKEDSERIKETISWFKETYPQFFK